MVLENGDILTVGNNKYMIVESTTFENENYIFTNIIVIKTAAKVNNFSKFYVLDISIYMLYNFRVTLKL